MPDGRVPAGALYHLVEGKQTNPASPLGRHGQYRQYFSTFSRKSAWCRPPRSARFQPNKPSIDPFSLSPLFYTPTHTRSPFLQNSDDGNLTESRLSLTPTSDDDGSHLICRVKNSMIPGAVMEDSVKLDVHCKWDVMHPAQDFRFSPPERGLVLDSRAVKWNQQIKVDVSLIFHCFLSRALSGCGSIRSSWSRHRARQQHQRRRSEGRRRPLHRMSHPRQSALPQTTMDAQRKPRLADSFIIPTFPSLSKRLSLYLHRWLWWRCLSTYESLPRMGALSLCKAGNSLPFSLDPFSSYCQKDQVTFLSFVRTFLFLSSESLGRDRDALSRRGNIILAVFKQASAHLQFPVHNCLQRRRQSSLPQRSWCAPWLLFCFCLFLIMSIV